MIFRKGNAWRLYLSVLVFAGLVTEVRSDILFKLKKPVKIGIGKQVGSKINWTDCAGKNPESFDEPPYSLDQADNCAVGAPAFGLECRGETCKVVDEKRLSKYLPGVRNGESVHLNIRSHAVELRRGQLTLNMEF